MIYRVLQEDQLQSCILYSPYYFNLSLFMLLILYLPTTIVQMWNGVEEGSALGMSWIGLMGMNHLPTRQIWTVLHSDLHCEIFTMGSWGCCLNLKVIRYSFNFIILYTPFLLYLSNLLLFRHKCIPNNLPLLSLGQVNGN